MLIKGRSKLLLKLSPRNREDVFFQLHDIAYVPTFSKYLFLSILQHAATIAQTSPKQENSFGVRKRSLPNVEMLMSQRYFNQPP